jgi:hypothetical protein
MAYSGTVSQTLSAEHVEVAKDQLYLLLSELANQGLQLWCIQKTIYPHGAAAARVART